MTFTEILSNEDFTADQKVEKFTTLVAKARKAYGNEDVEIAEPIIQGTEGGISLRYYAAEDKVSLAATELTSISTHAIHLVEGTEGAVLDKEIERLVATNPVLCNIGAKSTSAYI